MAEQVHKYRTHADTIENKPARSKQSLSTLVAGFS